MKTKIMIMALFAAVCFFFSCGKSTLTTPTGPVLPIGSFRMNLNSIANPLRVYLGAGQTGTNATLQTDTVYTDQSSSDALYHLLPSGFADHISSFFLPQGYMATFAQNADGTGNSICYIAAVSDILNDIPARLLNKISYVRCIPVNNCTKKGVAYIDSTAVSLLTAGWFYRWSDTLHTNGTKQYVPMSWGKGASSNAWASTYIHSSNIDHLLSFNEPDNPDQSNIQNIDTAISYYKHMLKTGLRMGSPACRQGAITGSGNWLPQFMAAAKADSIRVDIVTVHWYDWGNQTIYGANPAATANGVFNRFKAFIKNVHSVYPYKTIWVTEFNANPNRTNSIVHEDFMQQAAAWMDAPAQSYVERYSYFFPDNLPPVSGGSLTSIGTAWKNITSVHTFSSNIIPN